MSISSVLKRLQGQNIYGDDGCPSCNSKFEQNASKVKCFPIKVMRELEELNHGEKRSGSSRPKKFLHIKRFCESRWTWGLLIRCGTVSGDVSFSQNVAQHLHAFVLRTVGPPSLFTRFSSLRLLPVD